MTGNYTDNPYRLTDTITNGEVTDDNECLKRCNQLEECMYLTINKYHCWLKGPQAQRAHKTSKAPRVPNVINKSALKVCFEGMFFTLFLVILTYDMGITLQAS